MRHRSRFYSITSTGVGLATIVLVAAMGFFYGVQQNDIADAVSAQDFNPGRIIDDSVFYNKDSMSVEQIQDFLNRLIPYCDTWGVGPSEYGGGTRAQYAASRGWPGPPYACINNYHENPDTAETSFERGGGAFPGGISAAQIIYNAAQSYGVNPQVLLVMIKKESAGPLTADAWPMKSQYRYAMGYACPDSGPNYSASCSDSRAGFYKQVMMAAWQFKYYRDNPNSYRYAIGWNDIQYSPTPSCGTKSVNIENLATLSLYIYTPYTPNDGALQNYPRTAPCGAYGNRNFFMFFSEWFGTTYGDQQIDMLQASQDIQQVVADYQSTLGTPTSGITPSFNQIPRVWQIFTGGTIIWTPGRGAYPIFNGAVHDRWRAIGGSVGSLGTPTGIAVTEESDGRVWQEFTKGTIISSSSTGSWEVLHGPISDAWYGVGGSQGALGRPTSGVIIGSDKTRSQHFENGTIIRKNSGSPAYIVTGTIDDEWQHTRAIIGTPSTNAIVESSDGRTWQGFENGVIISPNTDESWTIRNGRLHDNWKSLGGSLGKLGRPTSNQVTESDGRVWQDFEKGIIIQKNSDSTAAAITYGALYDRWRTLGGSLGELGVPRTSTTTEADGRVWQDFEKGTVIWSPSTSPWEIQGGFYVYWKQHGGSLGQFGKPTSARHIEADSRWQEFEHVRLTWRDASGWTITPR